jgi:hypothetical protein
VDRRRALISGLVAAFAVLLIRALHVPFLLGLVVALAIGLAFRFLLGRGN